MRSGLHLIDVSSQLGQHRHPRSTAPSQSLLCTPLQRGSCQQARSTEQLGERQVLSRLIPRVFASKSERPPPPTSHTSAQPLGLRVAAL